MTVDCRWVENNLEALLCDRLSEEDSRQARAHIETCVPCRRQTQALNAIDPLIRGHFRRQLAIARTPRVVHKGRALGLSGAAAALVVLLLAVLVRAPYAPSGSTPAPAASSAAAIPQQTPKTKQDDPSDIQRLAPEPAPAPAPDRKPPQPLPPVTADSPELLVSDQAGYSHGLTEYRGRTVLIGVWTPEQKESVVNLERLYKANSANPKFRLLGVASARQPKPVNTTFPIFYNQGSKLFGAAPGEFVLLDENGAVERRGSLVKDFDDLNKTLTGR